MSTSHTRLERILVDLENGNLTDAKRQARGVSFYNIMQFARDNLGYSSRLAVNAAGYLKGEITFQHYCDNAKEVQS